MLPFSHNDGSTRLYALGRCGRQTLLRLVSESKGHWCRKPCMQAGVEEIRTLISEGGPRPAAQRGRRTKSTSLQFDRVLILASLNLFFLCTQGNEAAACHLSGRPHYTSLQHC